MCVLYNVLNVITKSTVNQMGTEIQGGTNKYKQLMSNKDPVWYAAGINKLIDRYEKRLTRYGDYVEKLVITWRINFFWFVVHLLTF